jgi:hypothetical protein
LLELDHTAGQLVALRAQGPQLLLALEPLLLELEPLLLELGEPLVELGLLAVQRPQFRLQPVGAPLGGKDAREEHVQEEDREQRGGRDEYPWDRSPDAIRHGARF